MSNLIVIL